MSIRSDLEDTCERRYHGFHVPTIPSKIYIRSITEGEVQDLIADRLLSDNEDVRRDAIRSRRAITIRHCVVNENGEREFEDTDSDLNLIMRMDGRVTGRIMDEIEKHCGFGGMTEDEEGVAVKNSEETSVNGSPELSPTGAA